MQEYLRRTRLSGIMDGAGFHLLALFGSLIWFTLLWGLRLPSLTAGASLYLLIALIRKKTRDGRLKRKEKKLRAVIGGELALERLLLSPPDQAHFEMAMLLSLKYPLVLLRTGQDGVLCALRGDRLLIAFAQLPACCKLDAVNVLNFQRAVRAANARRGVLCVPCPIDPAAREQALTGTPVSFLSREALIPLFGENNPATDAQLVALGRRKKRRASVSWLRTVLSPLRAKKYAWYGGLLLCMYQLTHLIYYAVPGLVCVSLAAACRCVRKEEGTL